MQRVFDEFPNEFLQNMEQAEMYMRQQVLPNVDFGGDDLSVNYDLQRAVIADRAQSDEEIDLRGASVDEMLNAFNLLQAGYVMRIYLNFDDVNFDIMNLLRLIPQRVGQPDRYVLSAFGTSININNANRVFRFQQLSAMQRIDAADLNQWEYDELHGSAAQFLRNLTENARGRRRRASDSPDIEIRRVRTVEEINYRLRRAEAKRRVVSSRGGGWFPYQHTISPKLDLTRYQIYHQDFVYDQDKNILHDANLPCIAYAFQAAGASEELVKYLLCCLAKKSNRFSNKLLEKICLKFRVRVDVKFRKESDKRMRTIKYPVAVRGGKKTDDSIQHWPLFSFGLVAEHYFVYDEVTNIYRAALDNSKSLKVKYPNSWWKIDYRRRNNGGFNSLSLVLYLLENKKKYLTPIQKTQRLVKTFMYSKLRNTYENLSYDAETYATPYGTRPDMSQNKEDYLNSIKTKQDKWRKEMEMSSLEKAEEEEKKKKRLIIAFDFECTTDGKKHKAYMCAYQKVPDPEFHLKDLKKLDIDRKDADHEIKVFRGDNCALKMRRSIMKLYKKHESKYQRGILLIAHNAGYDLRFLFETFSVESSSTYMTQGSSLKSFEGFWYKTDKFDRKGFHEKKQNGKKRTRGEFMKKNLVNVMVKDSLNFTMCRLSQFPKMFKLKADVVKEIMPYELYTSDVLFNCDKKQIGCVNQNQVEEFLRQRARNNPKYEYAVRTKTQNNQQEDFDKAIEADVMQFRKNVKNWNCSRYDEVNDVMKVDLIKYAAEYCKMDVKILAQGYAVLRHMFHNVTDGLNIDNFVSVNHLTNKYLQNYGCTDGVYELGGVPRDFIQNCVTGGKCMLRHNQVQKYEGPDQIADFDAVSLYPSAMAEMPGMLRGKPKIIPNDCTHEILEKLIEGGKKGAWFAKIRVMKIGKKWQMPICNLRTKTKRVFTNDMIGKEMFCSHVVAQDMVKFQGIEYEVIKGYYFDEGYNKKLKEFITGIFNERLKMKKEKNPMQLVYKLMMNGCYGRLILKPIETETKLIKREKRHSDFEEDLLDAQLCRNWEAIKEYCKLNERSPWSYMLTCFKDIYSHWAAPHLGVMILDYSKRIMNRLHAIAHENSWPIFYMDTDSMHLKNADVEEMARQYKIRHPNINNGELIGKKLGQFHNDFNLKAIGARSLKKFDADAVRSKSFVAFGKKCYMHELVDPETKVQGVSIAMKGFTEQAIYDCCNRNGITLQQLYRDVYEGKEFKANLLAGNRVSFMYNKDMTISSRDKMHRTIARTALTVN